LIQWLELSVLVLPLAAWWDRFSRIAVFNDSSIGLPAKIEKRGVNSIYRTFADRNNKITLGQNMVHFVVFQGDTFDQHVSG
jgi:hypothetical protein